MTYCRKLREWYEKEKRAGRIVDIKVYPGTDRNASLEEIAREVYAVIATDEREKIDITNCKVVRKI